MESNSKQPKLIKVSIQSDSYESAFYEWYHTTYGKHLSYHDSVSMARFDKGIGVSFEFNSGDYIITDEKLFFLAKIKYGITCRKEIYENISEDR